MRQSHEPSGQAPEDGDALETLVARAGEIGVVEIVNAILREALQEGASSVHFEPRSSGGVVRYRVGGELRQTLALRPELLLPVTARLKLMAGLDLSQRRVSQQGRIPIEYRQNPCFVTVATMPALFGESVVLRIVDAARGASWTWESLVFGPVETLRALLERPQGLILFTGPPGSGKTAALFGALNALDAEQLNIVAVMGEQPSALEGINLSAAGFTTAEAIRALAERDVDVIGVDEARERAEIEAALEAALAGHRVLAVFPAGHVAGAIERLIGWGVSPRPLSAGLSGIVASRLARRVCPDCREADQPAEESLRALGTASLRAPGAEAAAAAMFARGKGCDNCRGTGCRGWTGLYQVLPVDAVIARALADGGIGDPLRERLSASGLPSFRELASQKARAGVITVDEALRFTEE